MELKKQLEKVIHLVPGGVCLYRWSSERLEPIVVFHAILMDIRMPIMDGLDATLEIRTLKREDAKSIPIIAMTANDLEEDRENTRKVGMNAHLSKPIDPDILYSTLEEFFDIN